MTRQPAHLRVFDQKLEQFLESRPFGLLLSLVILNVSLDTVRENPGCLKIAGIALAIPLCGCGCLLCGIISLLFGGGG